MKRLLGVLFLCGLLLTLAPLNALASSGANTVFAEMHYLSVSYGSSERDSQTSLVNYVYASVQIPSARTWDTICSQAFIYSQGQLRYQGQRQCRDFGPGAGTATSGWYVYSPNDPNSRVQVRRGQNEIRIDYTYLYTGAFNHWDCQQGMCGTARVSTTIR